MPEQESVMPEQEDVEVDLDRMTDFRTPWSVHVVVTLRIAEHLADGRSEIGELAAAAGCDADVLGRVLRHLVSVGMFKEPEPGRFGLNVAARQLLDPGRRLFLDLDGLGGRMAHAWSTLLTVVRTSKPAYHQLFGRTFWEDLDAHPHLAAAFDAAMGPAGHGTPDPEILLDGDWEVVRSVVDVGGGAGAKLAAILRVHPEVRGTLVDLPRTVARAAEVFEAAGVSDRATAIGQSFFDPLPSGADVYLLSSVLNDWPDEETVTILSRCAEAAGPGGRIVVIGGVSPDDSPGELSPELVLVGGSDHPLVEFRELAQRSGLVVVASGRQPSGRFVVECRAR